jgi:hypothetical protein
MRYMSKSSFASDDSSQEKVMEPLSTLDASIIISELLLGSVKEKSVGVKLYGPQPTPKAPILASSSPEPIQGEFSANV